MNHGHRVTVVPNICGASVQNSTASHSTGTQNSEADSNFWKNGAPLTKAVKTVGKVWLG